MAESSEGQLQIRLVTRQQMYAYYCHYKLSFKYLLS